MPLAWEQKYLYMIFGTHFPAVPSYFGQEKQQQVFKDLILLKKRSKAVSSKRNTEQMQKNTILWLDTVSEIHEMSFCLLIILKADL